MWWWTKKKMDDLFFQDRKRLYSIYLRVEAYEQMLVYCRKSNPYETGGILIGNYSADQISANIFQITSPITNSRRSKNNFRRGSVGLKNILDSMWNQGLYYIGEWHYHPNSSSSPSNIDKNQMIILSQDKNLKCPEPILMIVGGRTENWNVSARLFANNEEFILYMQ